MHGTSKIKASGAKKERASRRKVESDWALIQDVFVGMGRCVCVCVGEVEDCLTHLSSNRSSDDVMPFSDWVNAGGADWTLYLSSGQGAVSPLGFRSVTEDRHSSLLKHLHQPEVSHVPATPSYLILSLSRD